MSLDSSRITTAVMSELQGHGFKPADVPFKETGKSALELIVDAVAKAVISEIVSNAQVSVSLTQSLNNLFNAGIPVPMDGGLALQTAWKLATLGGTYDGSTGGVS